MAYTETALYVDSAQWTAVTPWAATTAYTVGQIRRQLATPTVNNERCFICVVAGTSLGSEPAWSITRGASTAEAGGPTWRECTGQPAVNADGTSTNAWRAGVGSVNLGTIIKNTANTHYFLNTTSGTGGTGVEPSWNTTSGATTTDSSAVWTCIGPVGSFTTKWAAPCARLRLPLNNATNWLANADMKVFVGDDHAETNSSGTANFIAASNCQIICIDHTAALPAGSADLRTTASVTEGGSAFQFLTTNSAYVYGVQLIETAAVNLQIGGGGTRFIFEQCLFSLTNAGTSLFIGVGDTTNTGTLVECRNCTFHFQSAGQYISIRSGPLRLEDCSFTGTCGDATHAIFGGTNFSGLVAEGCDLSGLTSGTPLVGAAGSTPNGYFLFKDCKLLTSFLPYTTNDANIRETVTIDFVRCDSSGTNYRNERHMRTGTETTSTTVVRTSGASDGPTPISHQIAATANATFSNPFRSLALARSNLIVGSSQTATLYGIANDSRVPNNDEVWFDLEYLGSATTPQGSYVRGSKVNALATAAALTVDTSAWDSKTTARANSTAYVVGDARKVASNPGRVFICTGAGTSAAAEPTGAVTTWNPSDKSVNITLSGGNLTVGSSTATDNAVRAMVSLTGSKLYFEVTSNAGSGAGGDTGLGIATSSAVLTSVGAAPSNAAIVYLSSGNIYYNNVNTTRTVGIVTVGRPMCVAVDLDNKLIWFRNDGGNWNGLASANPATGVGGVDISSVFTSNAAFPINTLSSSFATMTTNFGATSFLQTPPSGFVAWNSGYAGYSSALDGSLVPDGSAVFRAGCRFKQALTLTSPNPQQTGYMYAYPKIGRASMTYWLDPLPVLS